jgi:recombination protein RecA
VGKRKPKIEDESLDAFLTRIHGEGIIAPAAKALAPKSREVLNAPLSLDIALSGGIPDGTICLITGKPKSGKTTLCLELLRNAQLANRPTFYVNIEKRCTPALLSTIKGLDPTKLQVIPHQIDKPLTAEDYLNIIERVSKTQKKAVVVIDSIAALSTMTEQEADIGSSKDMAGPAKLLSAFFRRAQQIVDAQDVILIFISQMMTNREPRGPKWMEKGGIAIQYACSVWLKVTWTQQWDKNAETNAPDGHDMHITVQSSALGRPLLPCTLPLRYGIGIDNIRDVVTTAENLGLIEKAGAWYSIPMFAGKGDPPKFQGLARLSNFLADDTDKLKRLETEIRDIVLPQPETNEKKEKKKGKKNE